MRQYLIYVDNESHSRFIPTYKSRDKLKKGDEVIVLQGFYAGRSGIVVSRRRIFKRFVGYVYEVESFD